jgi:ELMO domain-containing protein
MLEQLWTTLKPEQKLSGRISADWKQIGFQGTDPATDFRGMGVLGLENLLAFTKRHGDMARMIMEQCAELQSWYSFAVAGINVTGVLVDMIKLRHLDSYFTQAGCSMAHFQVLYNYAFIQFNDLWTQRNPASIMEFNPLMREFRLGLALDDQGHRLFSKVMEFEQQQRELTVITRQ